MPVDIIADESEGAIATARITTSAGTIMAMAEVAVEGRRLTLRGLHVHGEDVGPVGGERERGRPPDAAGLRGHRAVCTFSARLHPRAAGCHPLSKQSDERQALRLTAASLPRSCCTS